MVDTLYLAAVTLLFVPWVYGLYALARDGKNRLLPLVRRYLRGRRRLTEEAEAEAEREEQERQLY
ncbi:hypothetical protein [Halobaculum magnesiiphilum]|uniref:Cellulose biosynthesis protein BcsF n=1 Tax=Halobaculum magnesiiphilum TaxID=1017351 RepID=A0A8T8WDM2_9EURY|nr:hypothetical protein [Halobaculum magnesiiphilum]QZP37949.1 hypothetical protein K6T50_01895 [Halobaculum magnesiiphilum]